jgi:hypothetical protein
MVLSACLHINALVQDQSMHACEQPFIIMDRIHVSLLQVAWLTYMETFIIGGLQMPI